MTDSKTVLPADTVYTNATVITMDPADRLVEAVAVAGERITAVGSAAEVSAAAGPDARVIDLGGRTLLPGFIDAHSHFPESGRGALYRVDVNSPPIGTTESIDDIVAALRRKAEQTPQGQWVVGVGYDDTRLEENRHPNRNDLDRVSTAHPVLLMHISYHVGATNGVALERAGITRDTPQPQGGVIHKDADTGEPLGLFEEPPALEPLRNSVPPLGLEEDLAAIDAAAAEYARMGVTIAQNGFADERDLDHLRAAIERRRLPIRVVALVDWRLAQDMIAGKFDFPRTVDDRLFLGAAKAFADGSIPAYTGYLTRPYHVSYRGDRSYRGYPIFPLDTLTELVKDLHRGGLQIAIHGNGDAAIDDILHAVGEAQREHWRDDPRHIVIHSQMARDDQLDRMVELGVTPSFYSLHTYYWADRHWDIFMGPERAARMSPAGSAEKRGLRYTIHCDTPVVPMTPLLLVWAAVNRISISGRSIGPEQRITPLQALRAITSNAAWQCFREAEAGSIEAGKLADMVVLSSNPLADPEGIRDMQVLETIVGGRTVYRYEEAAV